jgi:hypothetical protein
VVRLALAEGAWSHVSGGSPGIWSVFVIDLCGFRLVSSDLRFSSSAMVVALVLWSFGSLSTMISHLSTTTSSTRQAFPGSNVGGARTTAHLRFVLVFVVVARWSN